MRITTYHEFSEWVGAFDSRAMSLLIIKGSAGIGKTYMVEESLRNANPVIFKGHATPLSIYKALLDNPDSIVIFDDVDELLQNNINISLLKQICEAKEEKTVYYSTTIKDIPSSFISHNKVILICNDIRVLGQNMRAVMDRALFIDFIPDKDEILKELRTFATDQDVLEFLSSNIGKIRLNFRSYTKGVELHKAGLDYEEYLKSEFQEDQLQQLIEEIRYLPKKERNEIWLKDTRSDGKSIRTLQRYLKNDKIT